MPGYGNQPPSSPWPPQQPEAPRKSRAVPLLLGALAVLTVIVGGLIAVAAASGHLPGAKKAAASSQAPPPALTEAGAQRACRTAFAQDWKDRQKSVTQKDVIVSTQQIELVETWKSPNGYAVNGTIHYTLTAWPEAPVQNTLDLTCHVGGTDAEPSTEVDNR